LVTTVATPRKCPGLDAPSSRPLAVHVDEGRRALQIEFFHRGRKHDVRAQRFNQRAIRVERPRILREVLIRAELRRIHKDADGNRAALLARRPDQRCVPGVKRAHGGHQPDGLAFFAIGARPRAQLIYRMDNFHQGLHQALRSVLSSMASRAAAGR
jgi:hypothetical protein